MGRWQLQDVLEEGLGRGHVTEREQLGQRLQIHLPRATGIFQQRFDLRGKHQGVANADVIERLDPEMIPREEQLAAFHIPQGKRKHPVEPPDTRRPPLLVGMNNDLGVGPGPELVTGFLQLVAQLDEIVDLAVEHDLNRSVFIANRLPAAADVDDAQPAMAQPDLPIHQLALAVRATMTDGLVHPAQGSPINRMARQVKNSANATHTVLRSIPLSWFVSIVR